MVADTVIYHPAIAHYLRFVATTSTLYPSKRKKEKDTNNPTAGRDKVLRTIQYFSRFYAWYLFRTNNPQSAITPFNNIKKQFSTTRKLLRLGKFIENLKAASVAYDNKNPVDPVLKYLAIGRQLGYAGYLTCDNVAVFDIIGVRKVENLKKLSETAAKAWLSGLACSAVAGVYTLWRLGEKEKTIDRKEGEGVVEAKKVQKYVFFYLSIFLSFFFLVNVVMLTFVGIAPPLGSNSSRISPTWSFP